MNNQNIFFSQEKFSIDELPALDIAVSRLLLDKVNSNEYSSVLRLYEGHTQVAFGPSDIRKPGYQLAVQEAKKKKFFVVNRLTGGHAVTFHDGILAFAFMFHDREARSKMHYYFNFVSSILQDALGSLGFACNVGELTGEYCPGQYSINIENKIKIAGIAQRIVANAVYVGGFIAVSNADLIKEILVPVYSHLEIDWNPNTVGSLENYKSDIKKNDVIDAIKNRLSSFYKIKQLSIEQALIQDASKDQSKYCN